MENIVSYLKWRGDISFAAYAFNNVDNLILSQLSFIDFADIVPDCESDKKITLLDAYNMIVANNSYKALSLTGFPIDLLSEAAKS